MMINWFLFIGLCCTQFTLGLSPDWPQVCPNIFSKTRWRARTPYGIEYAIFPVEYVVIHHTATSECHTEESCSQAIREIQSFHMDTMEFHDIGYNFVIGGDGNVYEGVGWHKVGAHTRGYNSRSMGIALMGNFSDLFPDNKMLQPLKDLLACAVELGELNKNYKLIAARQVSPTLSPGTKFYRELKQWPHFSNMP